MADYARLKNGKAGIFFLILILVGTSGCKPGVPGPARPGVPDIETWGTAWNYDRIDRSVCRVDSSMVVEVIQDELKWNVANPTVPGFTYKILDFWNGKLMAETDAYATGRDFAPADADDRPPGTREIQVLLFIYDFDRERKGLDPRRCVWWWDTNRKDELSVADGEKMLAKWGVKRLNY